METFTEEALQKELEKKREWNKLSENDKMRMREKEKKNKAAEQAEIEKIRRGQQTRNAGWKDPGYNFGLGEYVKDKHHYEELVRKKKREDPNFEHIG